MVWSKWQDQALSSFGHMLWSHTWDLFYLGHDSTVQEPMCVCYSRIPSQKHNLSLNGNSGWLNKCPILTAEKKRHSNMLILVYFFRDGLIMQSKLALNPQSSCPTFQDWNNSPVPPQSLGNYIVKSMSLRQWCYWLV